MEYKRFFRLPGVLALCCGVSACGTFVSYPGGELPDNEVATVNCYTRFYFVYLESCRVQAVDGLRPGFAEMFGNSSKILPGRHWIELAYERYFGGAGGTSDVCAFDIDLEPGSTYQVKAHSLKIAIPHLKKLERSGFYQGVMELEVVKPSGTGETRNIKATCSAFGGSMCRKDSDCIAHPDIRCLPQDGFQFGQCGFKDSSE